jgi:hypothetical protein
MQSALQFIVILLGLVAFCSFIGGFAANLLLVPYLDAKEVKQKTGRSIFWQFGNPAVPMECYSKEGHSLWRMRDRSLKIFAICAGLLALVMVIAAIANIPLEAKK